MPLFNKSYKPKRILFPLKPSSRRTWRPATCGDLSRASAQRDEPWSQIEMRHSEAFHMSNFSLRARWPDNPDWNLCGTNEVLNVAFCYTRIKAVLANIFKLSRSLFSYELSSLPCLFLCDLQLQLEHGEFYQTCCDNILATNFFDFLCNICQALRTLRTVCQKFDSNQVSTIWVLDSMEPLRYTVSDLSVYQSIVFSCFNHVFYWMRPSQLENGTYSSSGIEEVATLSYGKSRTFKR